MRIIVIEDEPKVAQALKQGLEGEHYDVAVETTGEEEGFFRLSAETFDLVVLDISCFPGRDGLEILSTMRQRGIQTPVLILAAKDAVEDRVIGLDCGADDYLVKPFAFPELLARIRALLRRGRTDQVLRLKAASSTTTSKWPRRVSSDGRMEELAVAVATIPTTTTRTNPASGGSKLEAKSTREALFGSGFPSHRKGP